MILTLFAERDNYVARCDRNKTKRQTCQKSLADI